MGNAADIVTTNAYLSPLAPLVRRRLEDRPSLLRNQPHNTAVAIIVLQTATVYLVAGLWKISGAEWQHGIALNYVYKSSEFRLWDVMASLTSNPVLASLLSYGLIVVQVAFLPLVAFSPRLREWAVAAAALMHLGIVSTLGLVGFGLIMLSGDAACMTDEEYRQSPQRVSRARALLVRRGKRSYDRPRLVDAAARVAAREPLEAVTVFEPPGSEASELEPDPDGGRTVTAASRVGLVKDGLPPMTPGEAQ